MDTKDDGNELETRQLMWRIHWRDTHGGNKCQAMQSPKGLT